MGVCVCLFVCWLTCLLVVGLLISLRRRGEKESVWRKKKKFNYNQVESFDYEPVLFEDIKHLGFNSMHKRVRSVENVCHMAEHKWAKTHHFDLYCGEKYVKDRTRDTRAEVVGLAHSHFKMKFKEKLGVKYFVPDPINGKVVMKFSDIFLENIYFFFIW